MSFDIKERQREVSQILQSAAVGKTFAQYSYFSPKNHYSSEAITYYVYIQPFLVFCFIVWLIAVIYALRTEDYMKKYGLMTTYSCLDVFMIAEQNIALIYVFTLEENYVQYEMCYVYEIAVDVIPRVLFLTSQWVKVCQACQKYLILSKPFTYKSVFSKLNVGIFLTVTIIVSISTGVIQIISIDFEKVVTIDKETMKNIDICRNRFAFSEFAPEISLYDFWLAVVYCVVSTFFPFVLMLVFGILSIIELRKQAKLRKMLNVSNSTGNKGLERLVKVSSAVTLCFVFLSLPQFITPIALKVKSLMEIGVYYSIVYVIFFMLNIPVNFLMFSWQSKAFRDKIRYMCTCWRRRRGT